MKSNNFLLMIMILFLTSIQGYGQFTGPITVDQRPSGSDPAIYIGKGANGALTSTAIGVSALTNTTTGISNTCFGVTTLTSATTGSENCAFGQNSLTTLLTGVQNTAYGGSSLVQVKGSGNIGIGYQGGHNITTGNYNIAIGYQTVPVALTGNKNVIIGFQADLPSGWASSDYQLSIQNTIFGKNMAGVGNIGISVVPTATSVAGTLSNGTWSILHVGGSAINSIPSLRLNYVPTYSGGFPVTNPNTSGGSSVTGKYLFIDKAGIVCQADVPSGVGTNSCSTTGNIPMVQSGGTNLGCSNVFGSGAGYSFSGTGHEFHSTGTTTTGGTYVIPASQNFDLYVNGWVGAIGYLALSDQRVKKDIKLIEDPISKIAKISGYTYNWNHDYKTTRNMDSIRQAGFLAQEILKVLPEAVVKSSDGLYGLNYSAIMPLLTEGIKEQQTQIEEQQVKIADLETKLEALTKKVNQLVPGNTIVKEEYFQVTPNPVTNVSVVSYKLNDNNGKAIFVVYDLQGKLLKQYNIPANNKIGQLQISKTDFGAGMYTLALISNNEEIQTKRFLISK